MKKQIPLALGLLLLLSLPAMGQIKIVGGGLGGGFSRSISVSNENGVKTTRVTENGKKFVIRQGDDLVEVEFANTYGPNDMDQLKEKHPDLHMHVTSFPKKSGDAAVELTVSVKEKVTAENESELKEKSEAAFNIFEKYTKQGGLGGGPFGRIDIRGVDFAKPARILEIEKDAEKRMEELRKRVLEMREKARGPLFGGEKKTEKKTEKVEEQKIDGAKDAKDPMKNPKSKKDLIKT